MILDEVDRRIEQQPFEVQGTRGVAPLTQRESGIAKHTLAALTVALALVAPALASCGEEPAGPDSRTAGAGVAPGAPAANAGAGDTESIPAARPNVVVVMTDDQDAGSVRVMRQVERHLASRGTTFSQAYATTPECCPSRATFLTGQYAHNHGVIANLPPDGGYAALRSARTLPVWLRRAGYRTGHVGRYLNGYGNPRVGTDPREIPPGWDEWRVPVLHTEFRMYGYTLNEDGRLRTYGERESDYQTDLVARKAAAFIRRNAPRREPFFLSVATLAPHKEGVLDKVADAPRNPRPAPRHRGRFAAEPLPRAPSYDELDVSDKARFVRDRPRLRPREVREMTVLNRSRLESLLSVDDLVGRLVRALEGAGELDDTLLVFTSDQGFLFGQHRLIGKGTIYDGAVRVPLIIRGPGVPSGVVRDQLVANVDVAATILDAAGATPDLEQDGISLLPLARDSSVGADRALLLELYEPNVFTGLRTPGFVLIEHPSGEVELYDVDRDPDQLDNRADDPRYESTRQRLERRLEELRDCRGDGCR